MQNQYKEYLRNYLKNYYIKYRETILLKKKFRYKYDSNYRESIKYRARIVSVLRRFEEALGRIISSGGLKWKIKK